MAGKPGAETVADEGDGGISLLMPEAANKFTGFSTKDGEVQPADKPAKAAPAAKGPAKPAKAAAATEDEPDEPDEGAEGEQEQPQRRASGVDKRIGQAVARQRAAERERDAERARVRTLEERLDRLERGEPANRGSTLTQPPARRTDSSNPPPDPSKYQLGDQDGRYFADFSRWQAEETAKKVVADAREEDRKTAQTKADEARAAEFAKKRDALQTKAEESGYDDFAEVVFNAPAISHVVAELCMDSEHGAQIAYELASDDKEMRRVFGLTPHQQAAWFGRQEARLSAETPAAGDDDEDGDEGENEPERQTRKAPKVSRAPAPPNFEGRGSSGSPSINAATNDFAAFERMAGAAKRGH